jgi:hypothetical protein
MNSVVTKHNMFVLLKIPHVYTYAHTKRRKNVNLNLRYTFSISYVVVMKLPVAWLFDFSPS